MRVACPLFIKPDGTKCRITIYLTVEIPCSSLKPIVFRAEVDDIQYKGENDSKYQSLLYNVFDEYEKAGVALREKDRIRIKERKAIEFIGEKAYKDAVRYAWWLTKPDILEEEWYVCK